MFRSTTNTSLHAIRLSTWQAWAVAVAAAYGLTLAACAMPDSAAVTGVQEGTDVVKSEQGALSYYQGVLDLYGTALNDYAIESGTLTDELRPLFLAGQITDGHPTGLDARVLPEGDPRSASVSFGELQRVRENARLARDMLAQYAKAAPKDFLGHLYAIEGLADLLLADLYCSGIPLSTVNPDGTFTLRAGSTTQEVYRAAITLFDSARTAALDSVRIRNFARVGKARALLALSRDSAAAAARVVADVPTDYMYAVTSIANASGAWGMFGHSWSELSSSYGSASGVVMSDREGGTGLPYATSDDPRTAADTGGSVGALNLPLLYPRYFARKYDSAGTTPMVVASGVEARLIGAEADLKAGGTQWLVILNDLRASIGLAPLDDPGSDSAHVRRLFDERAYWLFLTGHRQGDLRRLLRQYPQYFPSQAQVYPSGAYPNGGLYGQDVTLPVPAEERANPHYVGCQGREA